MNRVAQARRKKRFQEGSLEFRNRDFTFILNEATSYPVSFTEQERRHSKQLVEEYMLMANVLIGRHLLKYCEDKTILRAHDEIKDQRRDQMLSFFQKVDLDINMTDALSVSQSIKKIASEPNSEDKLNVINRKFLTSLKQARYVCVENLDPEDFDHFGLNFEIYTHFTSPIRRYADLLVHRLLTITLKEKENTRSKLDGLDYSEYAKEISDKSYNSKRAARDCEKLFHCLILKDFGHQVYDALITDVDYGSIGFYIHDLNMHFTYKLRDDKRIDELTFFEDDLIMAVNFKKPLNLALDIETYEGDFELNKSDWFKRSRAKEEQKTRREEEDQRINPF
jgi:DIS3-like exonuclease 2